jgi:hypothetical protein
MFFIVLHNIVMQFNTYHHKLYCDLHKDLPARKCKKARGLYICIMHESMETPPRARVGVNRVLRKHSQEGGGFEAFRIYLSPGYGDWVGISNEPVVDFSAVVHLKWRFII